MVALPESPRLGPEAQILDHEFERVLEQALDRLPAEWRLAVVLRDIEGLSTEEAAEITGVRQAAFKSRLHRGRMQLRSPPRAVPGTRGGRVAGYLRVVAQTAPPCFSK